jgi:osmotically-inducible protein OsmY
MEDSSMKTNRNDIQLKQDVIDELDWEPSVNAADIGVTVKDGIVTLSGYVPSYAEKNAAERATLRVAGVKAVAEEIEVRLPHSMKRTDADLAKTVLDAIKWHVFIPEDRLKVKIEDGLVTLEGEVEWQFQRDKVLAAVRPMTGVIGVINLIKVKPRLTPFGIKEKIRKALERTADEEASHITVEVHDGAVTLGGSVRTWVERDDAVRAAWSAPGVTSVKDRIQIKPPVFA